MQRIVIVDDDRDFASSLETVLTEEKYDVITYHYPPRVDELSSLKPNLILLDLWLTIDEESLTFAQELTQINENESIPLILMSSDLDVTDYAQQVNALTALIKPFSLEVLLDYVSKNIQTD